MATGFALSTMMTSAAARTLAMTSAKLLAASDTEMCITGFATWDKCIWESFAVGKFEADSRQSGLKFHTQDSAGRV
jgi:hypothetical protein